MSVASWIAASVLVALISPLLALAALGRAAWHALGARFGGRR